MTDEPKPDHQSGPTAAANPGAAGLPPESRAARSLTDRAKAGDPHIEEPRPEAEPDGGSRVWPRVAGVLILFLAAGGAWIWQNPGFVQNSLHTLFPGSGAPMATGHDGDAAAIRALEARVTQLEQRPTQADLSQRVTTLEQRQPSSGQPSEQQTIDLRPILARLNALEARSAGQQPASPSSPADASLVPPAPDLQPVFARLDGLEKQQARSVADPVKVDALAARIDALAARDPGADVRGKLDSVEGRLSELAADQAKLAKTSDRAERMAGWEFALAAGKPLGSISDAPPALARFATTAPPTEAGLRLAFAAAAQSALKVSQPDTEGKPFFDRVLARLQDFRLITVREGDRVVIGNATAATLARARMLLDAGDLGGTVREVGSLSGPPAEKMAPWLTDAKALLAARAALASLAETG